MHSKWANVQIWCMLNAFLTNSQWECRRRDDEGWKSLKRATVSPLSPTLWNRVDFKGSSIARRHVVSTCDKWTAIHCLWSHVVVRYLVFHHTHQESCNQTAVILKGHKQQGWEGTPCRLTGSHAVCCHTAVYELMVVSSNLSYKHENVLVVYLYCRLFFRMA